MRFVKFILLASLLNGCAGQSPPAKPPETSAEVPDDLAINRSWSSNADGYVYTTGYFTPEQLASKAWEAKRLEGRRMAEFCSSERIVRRDVRSFEPIAAGEPACALVIYSVACSARRPEWGSSLDYERKQALLDEPAWPIGRGCGEKSRRNSPPAATETPQPQGVVLSEWADCGTLPDTSVGDFRLNAVNYVNARTLVSPSYVRAVAQPYPDAIGHFAYAAAIEQKVHIIAARRPLPDDGANIFIEQTFAAGTKGFCVTLTARQGTSLWRKTLRSGLPAQAAGSNPGPVKSDDQYQLSETLQLDLARHMGIVVRDKQEPATPK